MAVIGLIIMLLGMAAFVLGILWPFITMFVPKLKEKRKARYFILGGICGFIIGSFMLISFGGADDIYDRMKKIDSYPTVVINEKHTLPEEYEFVIENVTYSKNSDNSTGLIYAEGVIKNISDSYMFKDNMEAYIIYNKDYKYEANFALTDKSNITLLSMDPLQEGKFKCIAEVPVDVIDDIHNTKLLLTFYNLANESFVFQL